MKAATRMVCSACGAEVHAYDELPFRCPEAAEGDDVDHVLRKVLDPDGVTFAHTDQEHPFLRYRELLHSYQFAREQGLSDDEYAQIVLDLDERVRAIDGVGFHVTPFGRNDGLSEELGFTGTGGVWVKDETGNVAGSHKARHLFGIAVYLKAFEHLGILASGGEHRLAIASCGNAALAAAVIARAMENPLEVFIPPHANPKIVAQLGSLGARLTTCPRSAGEVGDPCYKQFLAAVEHGALPFTVQGPQNGLVIEGGSTLAYEMIEECERTGTDIDHLFIQVGGGALAASCIQGFDEARALGVRERPLPTLHAVQTRFSPLALAFETARANRLSAADLDEAARSRSTYMRPLDVEPESIAYGILDDETYDWRAILGGVLSSGGDVLRASEEELQRAGELANRNSPARVCATGSAGLAGLLGILDNGDLRSQRHAVLFTGVER